jgi:hypothetical protein
MPSIKLDREIIGQFVKLENLASGQMRPGADVMIFKIFSPKKWRINCRF